MEERCHISSVLDRCQSEDEEEENLESGGSLTSLRLEPPWLARIQPHYPFDGGWILQLNQSHMSPAVRRERQRGQRDCEQETKEVVGMERQSLRRGEGKKKGSIRC